MKMYAQPGKRSERGIALLLCLFALLLLSAVGLSMAFMSDTETAINRNYRDSQSAYFGAAAGIQEAKERLMSSAADAVTPPSTLPSTSATTGVIYILNPGTGGASVIQPWTAGNTYFDTELCHENFPGLSLTNVGARTACATAPSGTYYTTVTSSSPSQGTSGALTYKWVRITQKVNSSAVTDTSLSSSFFASGSNSTSNTIPVCWDGSHQAPLPTGYTSCDTLSPPANGALMHTVYRVAALAVGTAGSRRMAVEEVALDPPFMTNAAVDSQDHVTLNGSLLVNGYDYCSCDCTLSGTGSNQTATCSSRAGTTCDTSRYAIYASGSVDQPTGNETIVAGTGPIAENQPWTYDILSLIDRYNSQAGAVNVTGSPYSWSCTTSSTALNGLTCGTQSGQTLGVPPAFPPTPPSNPAADPSLGTPTSQITYVPGNLQLTGNSVGSGVLLVNGDLDIHGGFQFYGLVIVRGVIKFTGGGSQSTNIYGAVLAGQESLVDNSLGGSANIYFNRCAVASAAGQNSGPLRKLSFKEVMY
ncbi:MAG: hypothetical protein ACR2IF_09265 [Terriglobales bacterium]